MVDRLRECFRSQQYYNAALGVDRSDDAGHDLWVARLKAPLVLRMKRQGVWTMKTYWRYINDPAGATAVLQESSVSLNVVEHPLVGDLGGGDEAICLIRYDFDLRDKYAAHLNVMQPPPILDEAHWRLPSKSLGEWDPAELVSYLLSEAVETDLARAGWA
jgi:hypothetical protein